MNLLDELEDLVRKTKIGEWRFVKSCFIHCKARIHIGPTSKSSFAISRLERDGRVDVLYEGDRAWEIYSFLEFSYSVALDYEGKEAEISRLIHALRNR